jgi:hypothetical protein
MEIIHIGKIRNMVVLFQNMIIKFNKTLIFLIVSWSILGCGSHGQIEEGSQLKDSVIETDNSLKKDDSLRHESLLDSNVDPNLVLPYCKLFLSENFYDLLGTAKVVSVKNLKVAFQKTTSEDLLVGVFVGGGKRILMPNTARGSSDESIFIERFYPDCYYYSFQNCSNMFMMTNPDVPQKIINYKVLGDELVASYCYNDSDKVIKVLKLKPTSDSIQINNSYCKIWIKNGNQRFIDVSFLKDSIKTDNFNINHQYFQEVLERFIQMKCGRRNECYTTDFEIVL